MARDIVALSLHTAIHALGSTFRVHGIFDRTWVLTNGERALTVTSGPYDGPYALRVGHGALHGVPLRPGQHAWLNRRSLSVGDLHIDLTMAEPWPARCAPPPLDPGALAHDLTLLAALPPAPVALQAAHLETVLRNGGLRAINWAAARLVGLGPGLTPSGDDVLVGVLCGLRIFGRRSKHLQPWSARAAEAVMEGVDLGRTTLVSRTALAAAYSGLAIEPLCDILYTLGTGHDIRGRAALRRVGHTSGEDMLAGAVLAARVVLDREAKRGTTLDGAAQRVP